MMATSLDLAIRYSVSSRELDVAASAVCLTRLADMLDVTDGRVGASELPDAAPFDMSLVAVSVHSVPKLGVRLRVLVEDRELVIEGEGAALGVLADVLRDLASDGVDDEHLHVEYFPGHFYLDESSVPAVIHVVPGSPVARSES